LHVTNPCGPFQLCANIALLFTSHSLSVWSARPEMARCCIQQQHYCRYLCSVGPGEASTRALAVFLDPIHTGLLSAAHLNQPRRPVRRYSRRVGLIPLHVWRRVVAHNRPSPNPRVRNLCNRRQDTAFSASGVTAHGLKTHSGPWAFSVPARTFPPPPPPPTPFQISIGAKGFRS